MNTAAPKTRKSWWRRIRHVAARTWFNVVSLNDSPHSIALGVAIGTFIAYLPIVGIQMVLSAFAAWILRANVAASLAPAWITNPVTIVPIFFGLYVLGGFFTGDAMTYAEMESIVEAINAAGIGTWDGIKQTCSLMAHVWVPMAIGGTIIGGLNAALFYWLTLVFVRRYQRMRAQRRAHWSQSVTVIPDESCTDAKPEA